MASWGANLVLACRKPPQQRQEPHPKDVVDECLVRARTEGHKRSEIEWWEVDMADLESVANLGKRYCESGRPLDLLMNNAGMGDSPAGDGVFQTKDGFEIVHQVSEVPVGTAPRIRLLLLSVLIISQGELSLTRLSNASLTPGTLYLDVFLASNHLHHILLPLLRQI